MDALTKFERIALNAIRKDLDAALAPVAAKYGITLATGKCTFSDNTFSMKVEGAIAGKSKEGETYVRNAAFIGLDPTWLGKRVLYSKREFTVRGLSPTGAKVLIDDATGKGFTAPAVQFAKSAKLIEVAASASA